MSRVEHRNSPRPDNATDLFQEFRSYTEDVTARKSAIRAEFRDWALKIEKLEPEQQDTLFQKVRKFSEWRNLNTTGDQIVLNALRYRLGPWYSGVVFGDILSYNGEDDAARRLKGRMQALLREALAWFPKSLFAQVISYSRDDRSHPPHECIAVARIDSDEMDAKAKKFREETNRYVHECGTTVQLDIHYVSRQRLHSIQTPDIRTYPADPAIDELAPTIHTIPMDHLQWPPGERREERSFLTEVAAPILQIQENDLVLLHMASGVDLVLADGHNASVAHLYVVANKPSGRMSLPSLYERSVEMLLARLCAFSMLQKSIEAESAARQARIELESAATKLDWLIIRLNEHAATMRTRFSFDMGNHIRAWQGIFEDLFHPSERSLNDHGFPRTTGSHPYKPQAFAVGLLKFVTVNPPQGGQHVDPVQLWKEEHAKGQSRLWDVVRRLGIGQELDKTGEKVYDAWKRGIKDPWSNPSVLSVEMLKWALGAAFNSRVSSSTTVRLSQDLDREMVLDGLHDLFVALLEDGQRTTEQQLLREPLQLNIQVEEKRIGVCLSPVKAVRTDASITLIDQAGFENILATISNELQSKEVQSIPESSRVTSQALLRSIKTRYTRPIVEEKDLVSKDRDGAVAARAVWKDELIVYYYGKVKVGREGALT